MFFYPAVIELKWNKQHQRLLKALEPTEGMRKMNLPHGRIPYNQLRTLNKE